MMTDEDAISRASNAGFRIYGEPWRWYWASKFWVDRGGASTLRRKRGKTSAGRIRQRRKTVAAKAKKTITGLQEAYLDYVNNYISVLKFAADYGMTEAMAKATIEKGAAAHEAFVAWYKEVRAL